MTSPRVPRRRARSPWTTATLALVTLIGGTARAEPAVQLVLVAPETLPFSPQDLRAAVETRVAVVDPGGAGVAVSVSRGGAAGIEVASPYRRQAVPVDGRTGADVARLVALAVVDVVRPLPGEIALGEAPAERPPAGRVGVGLAVGTVTGLDGPSASFEPRAEVSVALGHRWQQDFRVVLAAGFARASQAWMGRRFALDTVPIRLGLRWERRWLAVSAGPVARVYATSGLDGGSGAIAGGAVEATLSTTLASRLRGAITLSCDAYSERLVFRAAGQPVMTTGPIVPWLGVGLLWGRS